jgi:poly-gamma-glutamate synthesis protein (capsule biosynthesis protein)
MAKIRLVAVGDISLQTKPGSNPFLEVSGILSKKDILFGNLETVLSTRGRARQKSVILTSPPDSAQYLEQAGFDIVNLANNHILDRGPEGFFETIDTLDKFGISHVGAGQTRGSDTHKIIECRGTKLGFLGYCQDGYKDRQSGIVLNAIGLEQIKTDIERIRQGCDIVIISLHWGMELVPFPSPRQIKLAREIIDSGADIILGHHPHVVQAIERHKHGLIAHSLGNFQFPLNQTIMQIPGAPPIDRSIVLSIRLDANRIISFDAYPVRINGDFIPIPGDDCEEMNNHLAAISKQVVEGNITQSRWINEVAPIYIADSVRSWKRRFRSYGPYHLLLWLKWLLSPFVIRCYLSLLKNKVRCKKDNALAKTDVSTARSPNSNARISKNDHAVYQIK